MSYLIKLPPSRGVYMEYRQPLCYMEICVGIVWIVGYSAHAHECTRFVYSNAKVSLDCAFVCHCRNVVGIAFLWNRMDLMIAI